MSRGSFPKSTGASVGLCSLCEASQVALSYRNDKHILGVEAFSFQNIDEMSKYGFLGWASISLLPLLRNCYGHNSFQLESCSYEIWMELVFEYSRCFGEGRNGFNNNHLAYKSYCMTKAPRHTLESDPLKVPSVGWNSIFMTRHKLFYLLYI